MRDKKQERFNLVMMVMIIMILCMNYCNAQIFDRGYDPEKPKRVYIWNGFDLWNAFDGGKFLASGERRNTKALDYRGGFSIQVNRSWEFSAFMEIFQKIDFYGAGLQIGKGGGFEDLIGKGDLYLIPFLEGMIVFRDLPDHQIPQGKLNGEFFNHGFGLKIRMDQFILDDLFIELQGTLNHRADIVYFWGYDALGSGYLDGLWQNRSLYFTIGFQVFKPNRYRP